MPRIITGTLVLAASLLGLRSVGAVPATRSPTDACTLLAEDRVSGILGIAVGAGQHLIPNSTLSCGWSLPTDTNHTGKRVALEIMGPLGTLTPPERFENTKKPMNGITKTPVTDVGDDALYVTTPGLGTGLFVKKGNFVFDVRVYGFPANDIKVKEKLLAADVLAKL